jgi:hypothetical protein
MQRQDTGIYQQEIKPADPTFVPGFDNITLTGKIKDHKYTYNSALMIRAGCVPFDATGDVRLINQASAARLFFRAAWPDPTSK